MLSENLKESGRECGGSKKWREQILQELYLENIIVRILSRGSHG